VVLSGPLVEFIFPRAACGDLQMLFAGADRSGKDGAGRDVEGHQIAAVFDNGCGNGGPDFSRPDLSKLDVIT